MEDDISTAGLCSRQSVSVGTVLVSVSASKVLLRELCRSFSAASLAATLHGEALNFAIVGPDSNAELICRKESILKVEMSRNEAGVEVEAEVVIGMRGEGAAVEIERGGGAGAGTAGEAAVVMIAVAGEGVEAGRGGEGAGAEIIGGGAGARKAGTGKTEKTGGAGRGAEAGEPANPGTVAGTDEWRPG